MAGSEEQNKLKIEVSKFEWGWAKGINMTSIFLH